jgi:acyl-CoA synthetase (NDP forming)
MNELFAAQEADGWSGPVAAFTHNLPNIAGSQLIADMLIARQERTGSPVVVVAPGDLAEPVVARYREAGLPFFRDVATAFDSLQAYYDTLPRNPPAASAAAAILGPLAERLHAADGPLSEIDSAAILRQAGVPMVQSHRVADEAGALAAASRTGFPVVLKALAPGIAHKDRMGFVIPGIRDAVSLREAWSALRARVEGAGFTDDTVMFILQPMVVAKAELIVGVSWEEPLGHFLVVGLGGVYAEVLDAVTLFPIPTAPERLAAAIDGDRLGRLVRLIGGEAALSQLVGTLDGLQRLILAHGDDIRAIDINPLLIGDDGCMAVDALIVPKDAP